MQEKQAGCGPTGEKSSVRNSAGIVFEVRKAHRDLDPPIVVYVDGSGGTEGV
jgi:hypothetical protein